MLRANIKLNKENLSFKYNNSTLIVSYRKPEVLLMREIEMRKEFEKLNAKKPKEGDIECTTQWLVEEGEVFVWRWMVCVLYIGLVMYWYGVIGWVKEFVRLRK